ncbi:MAG: sugar kinase [Gemmatimonadaceae bacterium]
MSVLTLGETMVLFDPATDGPPVSGASYTLRFAGAESNFAIALSRLGIRTRWISRLGTDLASDHILAVLAAEGVDIRWVRRDQHAGSGAFMKIRTHDTTQVQYFRKGSAASRLTIGDVPDESFDGVRVVHLTGITPALSESAGRLVEDVADRARARDIAVTFDANYRPALWPSAQDARRWQERLLPLTAWYFCGKDEGRLLWDIDDPYDLHMHLRDAGARGVVIRWGTHGALVNGTWVVPPRLVQVRDEVGAGDAFDAGFVFAWLASAPPAVCAHAGHVIAAHAIQGTGDWETLPRLADVQVDLATVLAGTPELQS